jgi:toxin ParE1/3/4
MIKYFLSNKAVEDLSNIWDYTYETWSENQADRYYELLIAFCKEISESPQIGKIYNKIGKNIRGYQASHHIIFYKITEENEIEILRILHKNMDLKNRIQEL